MVGRHDAVPWLLHLTLGEDDWSLKNFDLGGDEPACMPAG
ncbi:hypothetical protein SAMN05192565_13728 [Methylobacterium gossipiicola]|uniref:Uncharacterized protein n=1 Tax=Methylobacterium gossipiicola TaxID=582675 RepID=A0A1I2XC74_9HYPH|nr:hypothetical protein SAMN05192565_13728 [Methylobacterium gossipiicola]